MILNLGLLSQLEADFGEIDVYSDHPETFEFFFGRKQQGLWDGFLSSNTENALYINSYATVCQGHLKLGDYHRYFRPDPNGVIKPLIQKNLEFMERFPEMRTWIARHPHLDGDSSHFLKDHGFKRWNLCSSMLGYPESFISKKTEPLPYLNLGRYITVHTGVGVNHAGLVTRPTKVWDTSHWSDLIQLIKQQYPRYKVVQIGSPMGSMIPGVDFTFTGKISDAYRVLAYSDLHIDGDSGHVHAARALGVRSVVIFGPTPAYWFGYPENINIQKPMSCSPCWWSNPLWVKQCAAGYKTPRCMNFTFPEMVFKGVKEALSSSQSGVFSSALQLPSSHLHSIPCP